MTTLDASMVLPTARMSRSQKSQKSQKASKKGWWGHDDGNIGRGRYTCGDAGKLRGTIVGAKESLAGDRSVQQVCGVVGERKTSAASKKKKPDLDVLIIKINSE